MWSSIFAVIGSESGSEDFSCCHESSTRSTVSDMMFSVSVSDIFDFSANFLNNCLSISEIFFVP